jgi:hypothetical protein
MKYAVETGSDAMICIPSCIKNGSDIQKLMGVRSTDTQTAWKSHKPISVFFIRMLR